MQAIGRELGRSVGTISREIKRNSYPILGYRPYGAPRAATAARARPKDSKLAEPGELHDYVKIRLLTRWSPQQISKLLIKEFPDDEQMRVSHETIDQALYFQARGGLKRAVKEALRTGRMFFSWTVENANTATPTAALAIADQRKKDNRRDRGERRRYQ